MSALSQRLRGLASAPPSPHAPEAMSRPAPRLDPAARAAPPVDLAQLRAGDRAAWQQLFSAYAGRIYRWAMLRGLSSADAEELAQETLAVAWRRIGRCRAPEALTTWLYQITRRLVANHHRKAWVRRVLLGADTPQIAVDALPDDALTARRLLATLPADLAEVLILRDVEGYTRDEVASLLSLQPGTVASRLRRARAAFGAAWADPPADHTPPDREGAP